VTRPVALGLAAALALASVPVAARQATGGPAVRAGQQVRQAVARQRGDVKRLERGVAAGEAGNRAAAQRLQGKDARIAELKRQLQALEHAQPSRGNHP
jgi:hypothetical protein